MESNPLDSLTVEQKISLLKSLRSLKQLHGTQMPTPVELTKVGRAYGLSYRQLLAIIENPGELQAAVVEAEKQSAAISHPSSSLGPVKSNSSLMGCIGVFLLFLVIGLSVLATEGSGQDRRTQKSTSNAISPASLRPGAHTIQLKTYGIGPSFLFKASYASPENEFLFTSSDCIGTVPSPSTTFGKWGIKAPFACESTFGTSVARGYNRRGVLWEIDLYNGNYELTATAKSLLDGTFMGKKQWAALWITSSNVSLKDYESLGQSLRLTK